MEIGRQLTNIYNVDIFRTIESPASKCLAIHTGDYSKRGMFLVTKHM
jgi:hypothetical protein